jgi:hypothetical protein
MIGLATINYANDNHNFLPERWRSGVRAINGNPVAFVTPYMFNLPVDNTAFAKYGNVDPGANLGRLLLTGYLGNGSQLLAGNNVSDENYASIRFCPGQRGDLSGVPAGQGSSYQFNPHWANTTDPTTVAQGATDVSWYRKLSDIPRFKALACDAVYSFGSSDNRSAFNHMSSGSASNTWNLLFTDGHVSGVNDTIAYKAMLSRFANSPFVIDDDLDILETEADGRDPNKTMADATTSPQQWTFPLVHRLVPTHNTVTVNWP